MKTCYVRGVLWLKQPQTRANSTAHDLTMAAIAPATSCVRHGSPLFSFCSKSVPGCAHLRAHNGGVDISVCWVAALLEGAFQLLLPLNADGTSAPPRGLASAAPRAQSRALGVRRACRSLGRSPPLPNHPISVHDDLAHVGAYGALDAQLQANSAATCAGVETCMRGCPSAIAVHLSSVAWRAARRTQWAGLEEGLDSGPPATPRHMHCVVAQRTTPAGAGGVASQ